jgi:ABC-2 type transport system permease protein
MRIVLDQVGSIARRSIVRTLRQPGALIPTILFPLMLFAVYSAGASAAETLPGFPNASYTAFAFAVPFMHVALFATAIAGTDMARDIESGFLQRLALTPIGGVALLVGQVAGAAVVGMIAASAYVVAGLIASVDVAAGVGGWVMLVALSVCISFAFAGLGLVIAVHGGNAEAVQGAFPLLFAFFFLSSFALPRNLIEVDWFRALATANPVSYLVEGERSLIIEGWNAQALLLGFGLSALIAALALALAARLLRTRLVRT